MANSSDDWSSDLFGCFSSVTTCCYGFWCCPCLAFTVSKEFEENRCFPLYDLLFPAAGLSLRVTMRNRYGIKGSLCSDVAISCFCGLCSWCQMHRELDIRKGNTS
ncbi:cornifelin homolog B-like [Anabas testudineus]|uniref:Plac8 onzin related protein 6 n=1 Tax=Anabas testudineus TaxID=64144 RepID=A0A3Q1K6K1_ANATE|nr:cornifelin homolog B-like [Anabas testudineus]XP_026202099.1 cornifelin homolog B-like [Anabas testudineus]